ncbi:hypothetical protein RD110_22515 [Rhodoferax koreense]|uniref:Uncharacterized protein n=1 Tax=Rhodoferax koreensis TaxID=1842727 RepID=A0A1P8K0W1_9BURK|nr:hypothetical protein [Rhodoferax koreense]APW39636.1 hypothetical protein RD110_22515 [Rhodoferax koreense]
MEDSIQIHMSSTRAPVGIETVAREEAAKLLSAVRCAMTCRVFIGPEKGQPSTPQHDRQVRLVVRLPGRELQVRAAESPDARTSVRQVFSRARRQLEDSMRPVRSLNEGPDAGVREHPMSWPGQAPARAALRSAVVPIHENNV